MAKKQPSKLFKEMTKRLRLGPLPLPEDVTEGIDVAYEILLDAWTSAIGTDEKLRVVNAMRALHATERAYDAALALGVTLTLSRPPSDCETMVALLKRTKSLGRSWNPSTTKARIPRKPKRASRG